VRILLTAHAFPPRSTAGVEVYTLRLAKGLASLGHEVLVLTAVHDLAAEPYSVRRRVHEGVPVAEVVNVHHRGTLEATYLDEGVERAVAPVFAAFRPECVHVQHLQSLSLGILEVSRRLGAAVVVTLHDYWLSCPRDGLRMQADLTLSNKVDHAICAGCLHDSPYLVPALQSGLSGAVRKAGLGRHLHRLHDVAPGATGAALRLLRRLSPPRRRDLEKELDLREERLCAAMKGVDLVIAPTDFARDRAVEFGVEATRLRTLRLGAVEGPPRSRRAGARKRFGYVGTLASHKGAHVLVEAFRGVPDADASLDLFGSLTVQPAYVEGLRRGAAGDARIRFHGPFAEGGQARVLDRLDALVLPSVWWENSPVTALEALAAGLPVIASAIGGVPEIVKHEVSGWLVPPGDAGALRSALTGLAAGTLLAEASPPALVKTVREGSRELVEIYTALRQRYH
jgi:glycosyltransferase involved in cell wall biosynthesis